MQKMQKNLQIFHFSAKKHAKTAFTTAPLYKCFRRLQTITP
jgi:hypothetical protein